MVIIAGMSPLILKLNCSNSFHSKSLASDQAITASVKDALHLECTAVEFTIYPDSAKCFDLIEACEIISEQVLWARSSIMVLLRRRKDFHRRCTMQCITHKLCYNYLNRYGLHKLLKTV
ncbi:hypothetical protein X798_06674 [Onchocerca flexuosa]|uniref:Uncharacterized protein n=1 Tax=Onchocerca flexuosa TaxID=387005 RepID=A0A238BMS4_9BILA|nr:hypothetical protein X798_06674 [Onchocerca flexuosa]